MSSGTYPRILHDTGLDTVRRVLDNLEKKKISIDDLSKITEFVSKNNYLEFNGKDKKQILGTAIDTKFAPPCACIFIDQIETEFLETQKHNR